MATIEPSHGRLEEKFTCLICGQEGLSEEEMGTHVQIEHVETTLCCPFCDLADITSDEMTLHINSVHFDDLTKPQVKQNSENSDSKDHDTIDDEYKDRKSDPDRFGKEHGGAIPKTKGKGLQHSHSLDQSPHRSPSRKGGGIKSSQSESNINRRGKLSLNFDTINEPGPSISESTSTETIRASTSGYTIRASHSSHTIRPSASYSDAFNGASGTSVDIEPENAQSVRSRLQNSIFSHNDVIVEENQDNNNIPLHPNLNQVLQPDINDNVEPDINSNMPAGFSCPLCQFITSSENLIQEHVNMVHIDVLSPARPRTNPTGPRISVLSNDPSTSDTMTEMTDTISECAGALRDEFPCPICLKIYDNAGELSLHVNQAHANIFSPDGSGGSTSFRDAATGVEAGPSSFHCPVCEMVFYERTRLEAHVNGHFSAEQTPSKYRLAFHTLCNSLSFIHAML